MAREICDECGKAIDPDTGECGCTVRDDFEHEDSDLDFDDDEPLDDEEDDL